MIARLNSLISRVNSKTPKPAYSKPSRKTNSPQQDKAPPPTHHFHMQSLQKPTIRWIV